MSGTSDFQHPRFARYVQKYSRRRARPSDSMTPEVSPLTDPAAVPAAPDLSASSADEAPAMTRRELREARERDTRLRDARRAPLPRSSTRRTRPAVTAAQSVAATESTAGESAAVRRAAAAATRSARLTRAARPGRRPRVAASVTATAPGADRRVSLKRRLVSNLVSVSAMAGVGLMLVATTVPANAFSRPDITAESAVNEVSALDESQELTVEAVAAPTVVRDGYTVISQQQQMAAKYGNRLMLFTNNPNGTVQWPFPTGAPITSGFGGRQVAGCGFCSTYHEGLDFTPGAGVPIQSIAEGVVSRVQVGGAYGNHVEIEHFVNGQLVTSTYSHMQYGSIDVAEGQAVTVGQVVGSVGSTGASTGPHLHLEIHLDGTPVDPFAWLQANAN